MSYKKPRRVIKVESGEWKFPPNTPPNNHMVLAWTPEYDGGKVSYSWAEADRSGQIKWLTMLRGDSDDDITQYVKAWCELPDTERLSMTKKTAVLHMRETHSVIYEVEVDADATEDEVADLANRLQFELEDGQRVDMTDWDCERVEFIEDNDN